MEIRLDPKAHLRMALRRYDAGEFFTAHEAWEKPCGWKAPEPDKTFLQGLIQVTAAFHHLSNATIPWEPDGCCMLALRRLERLSGMFSEVFPSRWLCCDIRERIQALNANEPTPELARARILTRCLDQ